MRSQPPATPDHEQAHNPFGRLLMPAGCRLSMGYGNLIFALPQVSPRAKWSAPDEAYRVQLPAPATAFDRGDCSIAKLWLRTSTLAGEKETLREVPWEYGYCE